MLTMTDVSQSRVEATSKVAESAPNALWSAKNDLVIETTTKTNSETE